MSWFHCLKKLAPSGICAWWWILWVVLIEAMPLSLTARRKLHSRLLNWYVCFTAGMTTNPKKSVGIDLDFIWYISNASSMLRVHVCVWGVYIKTQTFADYWYRCNMITINSYNKLDDISLFFIKLDCFLSIHSATTMKFDQGNISAYASLWPIIDCLLVPSPRVKQKSKLLKSLQKSQVSL